MRTQTSVMDKRTEIIYEGVRNVLVDALGVDKEEVTLDATLQRDLGVESIDDLDIVFRLERTFAIKIPRGELFVDLERKFHDDVGVINESGITYLRSNYQHLLIGVDEHSLTLDELTGRINVNSLVQYLETKLDKDVK